MGLQKLGIQGRAGRTAGLEAGDQAILLGEDQNGDDGKPDKDDPAIHRCGTVQLGPPTLRAKTKGLEHTGNPMGKMTAE